MTVLYARDDRNPFRVWKARKAQRGNNENQPVPPVPTQSDSPDTDNPPAIGTAQTPAEDGPSAAAEPPPASPMDQAPLEGALGDAAWEEPTPREREIVAWLQAHPLPTVAPAEIRFSAGEMQFGEVCAGWTPSAWAAELRRKAGRCEELHPDKAGY